MHPALIVSAAAVAAMIHTAIHTAAAGEFGNCGPPDPGETLRQAELPNGFECHYARAPARGAALPHIPVVEDSPAEPVPVPPEPAPVEPAPVEPAPVEPAPPAPARHPDDTALMGALVGVPFTSRRHSFGVAVATDGRTVGYAAGYQYVLPPVRLMEGSADVRLQFRIARARRDSVGTIGLAAGF